MKIPQLDYTILASFGSLELVKRETPEYIGQAIDYSESKMIDVQTVTLDSLNFPRLDLIKIDIEGMELDALAGGTNCIGTHHPIILVETIKTNKTDLRAWLERQGYSVFEAGLNYLALHKTDKSLSNVKMTDQASQ